MSSSSEIYRAKLCHPKWFEKREEVFRTYGKKCNRCSSTKWLNVHHKSYEGFKDPWDYPISNFDVLCDICHAKKHKQVVAEKRHTCGHPKCHTPSFEIRSCFKYCFPCNQKLLDALEARERDLRKAKQAEKIAVAEGISQKKRLEEELKSKERMQELLRQSEQILAEKNEVIAELRQSLEDREAGTEEIQVYDELLKEVNDDREKTKRGLVEAKDEIKNLENEIGKLRGEVTKDKTMRIVLTILVLVVIGLLCFSIFKEKTKPDSIQQITIKDDTEEPAEFSLNNAADFVGKFVEHKSRVFQKTVTRQGHVFINLGDEYPNQLLTLVVFENSVGQIDKIPNVGDFVSYSGVIEDYRGKPRVVIKSPAQLIVED